MLLQAAVNSDEYLSISEGECKYPNGMKAEVSDTLLTY